MSVSDAGIDSTVTLLRTTILEKGYYTENYLYLVLFKTMLRKLN